MRRMLRFLTLVSVCACSAQQRATSTDTAANIVSAVTLVRGACFGTCAQYSLTVSSNGDVVFVGFAYVRTRGLARAHISPTAARALIARFTEANFIDMWEQYLAGQTSCGLYATDAPIVELSLVTPTLYKKVVHDYGCSSAPSVLRELQAAVDATGESSRWLPAR